MSYAKVTNDLKILAKSLKLNTNFTPDMYYRESSVRTTFSKSGYLKVNNQLGFYMYSSRSNFSVAVDSDHRKAKPKHFKMEYSIRESLIQQKNVTCRSNCTVWPPLNHCLMFSSKCLTDATDFLSIFTVLKNI